MVSIKTTAQLDRMRRAGRLTAEARRLAGSLVAPGVTTQSIDRRVREFIESHGAIPSFLNYNGFPASCCISLNDQVIHGIPSSRKLEEGDLVKIDVGAFIGGYHGDCAETFVCGSCDKSAQALVDTVHRCFEAAFAVIRAGARIGDIGHAVQITAESGGCGVVREYIGHGIGERMHESPDVPNYGNAGHGLRLEEGMTIAVEPMINAGGYKVRTLGDRWTVVTADGSLSAHYENTIAITQNGPEILTVCE